MACLLFSPHHTLRRAQTVRGQGHLHSPSQFASIDRLVRDEFQKDKRGGLTVGLVENGQLGWSHSYGYVNERTRHPATNQTIYPIASMTKMVTGIMFLQLVEHGKIHLADPVERYRPEVYGHGVGFAAVRNVDSRLTALGHGGPSSDRLRDIL
jgi:CubicO group peptidase (beta-lactamase class C family)